MRVRIECTSLPNGSVEATLADTPTGKALFDALPCVSTANTWGEEVFFEVPVQATLDPEPKVVVPQGTVCFWVQGSCVAIPFGPTPISEGKECRLVTAVNVIGNVDGDPKQLGAIQLGDEVTVCVAE